MFAPASEFYERQETFSHLGAKVFVASVIEISFLISNVEFHDVRNVKLVIKLTSFESKARRANELQQPSLVELVKDLKNGWGLSWNKINLVRSLFLIHKAIFIFILIIVIDEIESKSQAELHGLINNISVFDHYTSETIFSSDEDSKADF